MESSEDANNLRVNLTNKFHNSIAFPAIRKFCPMIKITCVPATYNTKDDIKDQFNLQKIHGYLRMILATTFYSTKKGNNLLTVIITCSELIREKILCHKFIKYGTRKCTVYEHVELLQCTSMR